MIPVSTLVAGKGTVSERLGVRRRGGGKPIVFWNITWACNLRCVHCYINAGPTPGPGELGRDEALRVAKELIDYGVPMVVLSGGEPLIRRDFWDILGVLSGGTRVGVSTNGTLITRSTAKRLANYGVSYVGISLDSHRPEVHDSIRGVKGAFKAALRGALNAISEGLDVGFRITVMKGNLHDAIGVVRLAEEHGIPRVAVYLVDAVGRARRDKSLYPSPGEVRKLVERLTEEARRLAGRVEIILVRAPFAGVYLALNESRGDGERLRRLLSLVPEAGCGARSVSIYPDGTVRPCQFIENVVVGDLKREKVEDVLSPSNPRLRPFIEPWLYLRGPRCSRCRFKRVCGGGSRARAEALNGDFWGDDPLYFLPEEVIQGG